MIAVPPPAKEYDSFNKIFDSILSDSVSTQVKIMFLGVSNIFSKMHPNYLHFFKVSVTRSLRNSLLKSAVP